MCAAHNNGEIQVTKDFNNISNQFKFAITAKWPDWDKVCGAISFGIFSLTAIYAEHRTRQGEIAGLSTWYVSAYQRTLYGESIHPLKVQYFRGDQALRNQLIDSGAYDAVKDAKDFIIKAGIKMENSNDDLEALGRYGSALAEKYKTKTAEETKNAIFNPLMEKAKAMFNR